MIWRHLRFHDCQQSASMYSLLIKLALMMAVAKLRCHLTHVGRLISSFKWRYLHCCTLLRTGHHYHVRWIHQLAMKISMSRHRAWYCVMSSDKSLPVSVTDDIVPSTSMMAVFQDQFDFVVGVTYSKSIQRYRIASSRRIAGSFWLSTRSITCDKCWRRYFNLNDCMIPTSRSWIWLIVKGMGESEF